MREEGTSMSTSIDFENVLCGRFRGSLLMVITSRFNPSFCSRSRKILMTIRNVYLLTPQRYKTPKRRDNRLTELEFRSSLIRPSTESELENSSVDENDQTIMVGKFTTISWPKAEHFLHRSSPCSIRTIEHYVMSGLESAFRPCGILLPLFTRSHTS